MYLCEKKEHKFCLISQSYENWSLIWLVYNQHSGVRNSRCSVSSVGRASVLWAEGHGFEPHTEHNVTLQQLIHHYLRFDGHSNYYVLTAISQKQSLYLLYMNIAINASCIRVKLCLIWRQTFTETYSKYLYHYLWPDAGSIPVAARESVGWYLWKTALFPEPFCLILFYLR